MLLLLLALQDVDDFYKFKPGTAWTYRRLEGGQERTVEAKVVAEKDGKVSVEWNEKNLDGSLHEATDVEWSVKDEILWAQARSKSNPDFVLDLPVLKVGAKKGDAWTTDTGESTHLGVEEVKVPAGAYKDAVRTQLKAGETRIDFHLAPKVGLVKISIVPETGPAIAFELK